jgi:hypothetical protein
VDLRVSLKHLISYIQPAFEVAMTSLPPGYIILNKNDSTTAACWLHHSSFNGSLPNSPSLCLWAARASDWLLLLHHSSVLFSKWFPGEENQVANSLSWDHHITKAELCPLLQSCCFANQIPRDFAICPLLPCKLSLQIMTWLRRLPPSLQSPKVPTLSKIKKHFRNYCTFHNWIKLD